MAWRFEVELAAGESTLVRVTFTPREEKVHLRRNLSYEVRTTLRRYVCELRDNYVVTDRVKLPKRLRQMLARDSEAMTPLQFSSENGAMVCSTDWSRARSVKSARVCSRSGFPPS